MARIGRPPLTEATVRERIEAYCARYDSQKLNAEGFPAYPSGRRETAQHREWVSLYRAFRRMRERATPRRKSGPGGAECPVCLRPNDRPGQGHPRCLRVVDLVRELGPEALERIRSLAFPDEPRAAAPRPRAARRA
jgi:hypothetical protein